MNLLDTPVQTHAIELNFVTLRVQRLPVVADELVVAHAGRQHAAADELQREMHDRQGVWNTVWPGAAPAGRL